MSILGKLAPNFQADAVYNDQIQSISLTNLRGRYVILLFYPLDFTFVCPTELYSFQEQLDEFKALNCQILGCSIDSPYTHLAWLNTPKKSGGIQGISYPLISDIHKTIARDYGVLNEEAGVAYRGLILIDKEGIVRHTLINDLPIGRNSLEALRTLQALIAHETNGMVCPANWHQGDKMLHPTKEDLMAYASQN